MQRRRHDLGAKRLDAPQCHAHALGLENDADAFRLQLLLRPIGDGRSRD
jgi:hypothetical protein